MLVMTKIRSILTKTKITFPTSPEKKEFMENFAFVIFVIKNISKCSAYGTGS
jgi:hypothetical protein